MVRLRATTTNGLTLPFELSLGEDKDRDLKAEIFDKAGAPHTPPAQQPHTPAQRRAGSASPDCLDQGLGGDVFELIISFLTPRSLALASCASRRLRAACSRDEVWMPWLRRFWDAGDRPYHGARFRATRLEEYLHRHHKARPLHTVYIERARARRRVRAAWGEVRNFAGPRGSAAILPPVSESDVLDLEQRHGCRLPLELRELYLVANGEREGWGLGEPDGLVYGLRLLSLEEVLALRAEQPGGRLLLPPSREGNTGELDVLPLTAMAGIGSAGERFVITFEGVVYKTSGMSVSHVGFLSELLRKLLI